MTQIDPTSLLLINQNTYIIVNGIVYGTDAATAGNYGNFFTADRAFQVIAISEVHRVLGTDAGAVSVTVEKATSGTAPDSGVVLLSTAFSLKATINTPQFGTLTTTAADLLLARADRLILKDAGTLTAVEDVCVTVILQKI